MRVLFIHILQALFVAESVGNFSESTQETVCGDLRLMALMGVARHEALMCEIKA